MGWVVVSRMPDIYESNARVYMNADEALTPLLRGLAVESDVDARLRAHHAAHAAQRHQYEES